MGIVVSVGIPLSIFGLYVWKLHRAMTAVPPEALAMSPRRWTTSMVRDAAVQIAQTPLNTLPYLPPATGRRYIVVGGSGFVGGWIILHLLMRGEDPKNIRIIDIRRPVRKDMLAGKATEVEFVAADIRDVDSVRAAFNASWPTDNLKGITVIHSAAGMRYFERDASLVYRSAALNVDGARNVLNVAQETPGVDIFLFTSSGSIPIPRTNFWAFPWNSKGQVRVAHDLDPQFTKHEEFFSNYSYTKYLAESLVRKADNRDKGFRTGCLRPGSAIYGAGGDLMAGAYLKKGINPSWIRPIIQSMAYVENVSYAHLVYEARLIEAQTAAPDAPVQKLGGDCFLITNTGDPISYGDLYFALNTLTDGRATFPIVPAGPMFLLAHLIEFYHLLQSRLTFLPPLQGDIINLQPSLFDLVTVHLKLDDSRARLPPSEGGLGYQAPWTTLDGVCQLVSDHLKEEAEEAKDKNANGIITSKIPSVTIPELSSELRHR